MDDNHARKRFELELHEFSGVATPIRYNFIHAFDREVATMFSVLLLLVGIGAACALIYNVAVYALPFAVGVWVGFAVLHWGGGPILGIVIGLVAGGMAYGVGEQIFEHSHSVPLRLATAIIFVVPAVYVGYSGTLQLSALAMSSSFWEHVLAVIAAISVGSTAFTRLVTPRPHAAHT